MERLGKTLSLSAGIALAITMVVGSGLLVLPGVAFTLFGSTALLAWLLCSVAIVPALFVFARLGARFPGAGGMALFVQSAFSRRAGAATEILILGTAPGGAALLLIAGNYAAAATSSGRVGQAVGIVVTVAIATTVILSGGKISGNVNRILAVALVLILATISVLALILGNPVPPVRSGQFGIFSIFQATSLVFFAFVGWELLSFTTEEFKNAKRDFPIAIAVSYIIVVGLYLLIAFSIQHTLQQSEPMVSSAPFVALIGATGIKHSQMIVGILGFFIALSNVIAIVWAFSRLLFASAREGLLPGVLAHLSDRTQIPSNSVVAAIALFLVPTILNLVGVLSLDLLFKLAGACFLVAYIIVCISFMRVEQSRGYKLLSVPAIALSTVMLFGFGFLILYPVMLFVTSYFLLGLRRKQRKSKMTS